MKYIGHLNGGYSIKKNLQYNFISTMLKYFLVH